MLAKKYQAALVAALLFYVISSPYTYKLVDSVVGSVLSAVVPQLAGLFKIAEAGCPTQYGLLVHAAVFGVVSHLVWHGV